MPVADRKTWGSLPQRTVILAAVGVVLFSCALDALFYTGYYASDDTGYLIGTWKILEHGDLSANPGAAQIRLTVVGWNLLVSFLFGFKIPLIAASYIVFHQVLNVLTFALARRVFDDTVGLLAMYCVATLPLAVTFSTTVLPDLPMTCFLLIAILAFRGSYGWRTAGKPVRSLLAIFAAGLSIGLAYMAKETALIMLPFFFGWWLYQESRRAVRTALVAGSVFVLGLVVVFVAEWAILSHWTGHSFVRMAWTLTPDGFVDRMREYPYGLYPLERMQSILPRLEPWFVNTRFEFVLAAVILVYPFVRGRKLALWFAAVWFVVYYTWGSMRLTEYLPAPLQPRYYLPALPLLLILYAFVVVRMCRAIPQVIRDREVCRGIQAVIAVILIIYPLPGLHRCDRAAGKAYWADVVNNSTTAITAARLAGGRPIVLSGTVSAHVDLLLAQEHVEDVLLASACRPGTPEYETLAERGFYYIELWPPRKLHVTPRFKVNGVDEFLHPLVIPPETDEAAWQNTIAPDEKQMQTLGRVSIAGQPGTLRRLRRFDSWHKRTAQIAYVITQAAGTWPDLIKRSAYLYEWVPDR